MSEIDSPRVSLCNEPLRNTFRRFPSTSSVRASHSRRAQPYGERRIFERPSSANWRGDEVWKFNFDFKCRKALKWATNEAKCLTLNYTHKSRNCRHEAAHKRSTHKTIISHCVGFTCESLFDVFLSVVRRFVRRRERIFSRRSSR
jgi:hypothetical protein